MMGMLPFLRWSPHSSGAWQWSLRIQTWVFNRLMAGLVSINTDRFLPLKILFRVLILVIYSLKSWSNVSQHFSNIWGTKMNFINISRVPQETKCWFACIIREVTSCKFIGYKLPSLEKIRSRIYCLSIIFNVRDSTLTNKTAR